MKMAQCSAPPYPSVFMVDTQATYPPVPPRRKGIRQGLGTAQILLFLLVSLALLGVAMEALFIYHFHRDKFQPASVSSVASKSIQGKEDTLLSLTPRANYDGLPSKPMAHLTGSQDVVHSKHIMFWSTNIQPILHGMKYKEGKLVIQEDGYYYIYSKVFFKDTGLFHHSVCRTTSRYLGDDIPLLASRRYRHKYDETTKEDKMNSFLGGVFHLLKDDSIFVKINDVSRIERHDANENYFGAYMI